MNIQEHQKSLLYQLSQQYVEYAHKLASGVRDEHQLVEYYQLIQQAIRGFQYVKERFQLSIEQDYQVTVSLVNLLLDETHEIELAEQYLNSVRTRLQRTTLTDHKYMMEFYMLYEVPMRKSDKFEFKNVVRSLNRLIESLEEKDAWKVVFRYCRIVNMSMEDSLTNSKAIIEEYNEIFSVLEGFESDFYELMLCMFVSFMLGRSLNIDDDMLEKLEAMQKKDGCDIKLRLWGLLLRLLWCLSKDESIDSLLNYFEEFLLVSKDELNDQNSKLLVKVKQNLTLKIELPLFNYTDCKNILTLFQSVSYLTTCYCKTSKSSAKDLPKVLKCTEDLKNSIRLKTSLSRINFLSRIYNQIIDLCHFYEALESMILKGAINGELPNLDNKDNYTLLEAMNSQLNYNEGNSDAVILYSSLARSSNLEMRLIALVHSYVLRISILSESKEPELISSMTQDAYAIWSKLISAFKDSIFVKNNLWHGTLICVWFISKSDLFTERPLPDDDSTEKEQYIERLTGYFKQNSLLSSNNSLQTIAKQSILKKSLMLQFMINYLGGTIMVSDIQERCILSKSCFEIFKNQHMPTIEYLAGSWHLANCIAASNNKEAALMKEKLNNVLVKLNQGII